MCGIAAVFSYHYAAPAVDMRDLGAIADAMARRGPDGKGEWVSPGARAALAHRRLSIIDLSERGAQPMLSEDGAVAISFNGEIYNYRALRKQLEADGCRMRSDSDTEVLLHLYMREGEAMLSRLRGMFAFALWDSRKEALLLARDAYGIKPLYFADDGWTVRAASQVKALLHSPRVSRAEEPAGIAGFYLLGSIPEPFTLYQQVRSVPAGSFQWVTATGPQPPRTYFDVSACWGVCAAATGIAEQEGFELVRASLRRSVRDHLVSDVPVGIFLSAGIDSAALLGLMRDESAADIRAVTIAFDEFAGRPEDESGPAAEAARTYGASHTLRKVTRAEFLEDFPRIAQAMDQPSIDGVNTWFAAKAAREQGLKVAISGVGGDELFGGYPSFASVPRWARAMWLPSRIPGLPFLAEAMHGAFPALRHAVHPKAVGAFRYGGSYEGAWLLRRALFLPHELPEIIGAEMAAAGMERLGIMKMLRASRPRDHSTAFGRVAALESCFYLRNQLLRDTDWASMAHGVEVRTPLVDSTLLAETGRVLAARRGPGKRWLAASPSKPLPAAIDNRPKTGFVTPVAQWQAEIVAAAPSRLPWARQWSVVVEPSARYPETTCAFSH